MASKFKPGDKVRYITCHRGQGYERCGDVTTIISRYLAVERECYFVEDNRAPVPADHLVLADEPWPGKFNIPRVGDTVRIFNGGVFDGQYGIVRSIQYAWRGGTCEVMIHQKVRDDYRLLFDGKITSIPLECVILEACARCRRCSR